MASPQPVGTFLYSRVVEGVRYDVFGRLADDGRMPFAAFDVYDPDGNWLTEGPGLETPPGPLVIRYLVVGWKLARAVVVAPSEAGWQVVHVGREVRLALAASWWPL